jgi:hypothetical protein
MMASKRRARVARDLAMRQIGKTLLITVVSLGIAVSAWAGPSKATQIFGTQPVVLAASDGPATLAEGSARLTLNEIDPGKNLAARIAAISSQHRLYLVLKDLRVQEQPGILYRVYVDLPADAKPGRDDPHFVGVLNFFNAQVSGDVRPPDTGSSIFFSRDITALLKNLQSRKLLSAETTVTIVSSGTPASNSNARIGRIEIIEQ